MNILYLIDNDRSGGAQTIVKQDFKTEYPNKYIYILNKNSDKNKLKIPLINSVGKIIEICKLITTQQFDIIYTHLFSSNIYGIILKIIFPKIKLVIHEHGKILTENKFYSLSLKLFRKIISGYIVPTKYCKEILQKKLNENPNKIHLINLYADSKIFNIQNTNIEKINEIKDRLKIKENEFVIGYVGRLHPIKNPLFMFKLKSLAEKNNWKIIFIGEGELKDTILREIKDKNLNKNYYYLGERNDMNEIYPLFNLVVSPSLSESFGLVPIEANRYGIPVLANVIPAFREIVKDGTNGYLFNVNNISNFEDKFKDCLKIEKDSIIKYSMLFNEKIYRKKLTEFFKKL